VGSEARRDFQDGAALLLDDKPAVAGRIDLEARAAVSAVDETPVRFSAMERIEGD
jgi:hypothetical protein